MDNSNIGSNTNNDPKPSTSHEILCNFDTACVNSGGSFTSGSGYASEVETEASMVEECLNNQNNNNPFIMNNPSQQSLENYPTAKNTFSDLLGPSDSELFQVKKELVTNLHVIEDAEVVVNQLLNKLQSLWLNIDDKASLPPLGATGQGEHKLLQLIHLTTFVVKEMETEWNAFVTRPGEDCNKLKSLEQSNRLLREQLESSRVIQSCLESELKYLEKEKSLLNEEVKEMSLQIANLQQHPKSGYQAPSARMITNEINNNVIVPKTLNQTQQPSQQSDSSKGGYSSYQHYHQQQTSLVRPLQSCLASSNQGSRPTSKRPSTASIRQVGIISNTNIRKREHDFDSIMNFVKARGTAMDSLNTQMEKYDEDFQTLQEEIYQVAAEKLELHKAYEALLEEHKKLLKERTSYEGILNLILKERKGTEESIHTILETLIAKLNAMSGDEGTNSRFTVLESALHSVQCQNTNYRDEISELKNKLHTVEQNHLNARNELEANFNKAKLEAEELKTVLQSKTEECLTCQKCHHDKYAKLQELYEAVVSAKVDVDKALAEKEVELQKQQAALESSQKGSFRQQKKLQELQRANHKLLRETQDQKRNMEQLNVVVSQLRTNLKEQKVQWNERVKTAGDEAAQVKDHCRWLQAQIDLLNRQLSEAHERVKTYEKDKTTLAQQVLSAEEERKVVDRKLEELRAALQGDTVLREALMERNEALQIEINRLRRAKLMNMGINREGDYSEPPSEMSTLDQMSSIASVLPPTNAPEKRKETTKKNRYSAGLASNNHYHHHTHGKDAARNAISAHTTSGVTSQGESPSSND